MLITSASDTIFTFFSFHFKNFHYFCIQISQKARQTHAFFENDIDLDALLLRLYFWNKYLIINT